MNIFIYNTLTKKIEPLKKSKEIFYKIYCCGPTVYNKMHLGNFRTFLIQDILIKLLLINKFNPYFIRNITDLDEKILNKLKFQNIVFLKKYTKYHLNNFVFDYKKLKLLKPHIEPKITNHIIYQIILINNLINKKVAYIKNKSILYDIDKNYLYGCLSNRKSNKKTHFSLWKFTKKTYKKIQWYSPWGYGVPGWHTECSSIIQHYFQNNIDLHSGGIDLIFPHHDNELAQLNLNTNMCKYWLHIELVTLYGNKMSKRLKNIIYFDDLIKYSINSIKLFLIFKHYQKPLNFNLQYLYIFNNLIYKLKIFFYILYVKNIKYKKTKFKWIFLKKCLF
ncbi:MAG: hypothetical protein KF897_10695, partial [Opitutaceae bacterium]|nr:hypothetical protein [Opitutaceae bacterium]